MAARPRGNSSGARSLSVIAVADTQVPVRLVMGDQTRLGVTLNIATEWIFCASCGCRRVRCKP
jgi:hypothetical protein